jgi:hypothetical protein
MSKKRQEQEIEQEIEQAAKNRAEEEEGEHDSDMMEGGSRKSGGGGGGGTDNTKDRYVCTSYGMDDFLPCFLQVLSLSRLRSPAAVCSFLQQVW